MKKFIAQILTIIILINNFFIVFADLNIMDVIPDDTTRLKITFHGERFEDDKFTLDCLDDELIRKFIIKLQSCPRSKAEGESTGFSKRGYVTLEINDANNISQRYDMYLVKLDNKRYITFDEITTYSESDPKHYRNVLYWDFDYIKALILGFFSENGSVFLDVDTNINEVQALSALGVVNGYEDGTFRPKEHITRADFVTMLIRIEGKQHNNEISEYWEFLDVSDGAYYSMSIKEASAYSFIKGDGEYFYPDEPITIEDMCVIIARANRFTSNDISRYMGVVELENVSEYARGAITAMNLLGLMDKTENFKRLATRLDVVTVLYNSQFNYKHVNYKMHVYSDENMNKYALVDNDYFYFHNLLEGYSEIATLLIFIDAALILSFNNSIHYELAEELSQYFDEYAPNIKSYLNKNPDIKARFSNENDEIFCIPWIYGENDEVFSMSRNIAGAEEAVKWLDEKYKEFSENKKFRLK